MELTQVALSRMVSKTLELMGHWVTSTYIPREGRTWFEDSDDKDSRKVRKTEYLVGKDRLAHTAVRKEPFLKELQTAKDSQRKPLLSPAHSGGSSGNS